MKPEGLSLCCMSTAAKGDVCVCVCVRLCACVRTCMRVHVYSHVSDSNPLIVLTAYGPEAKPLS